VANLIGYYSGFDIGHIKVGADIKIHNLYNQLYDLSHMKKNLLEASKNLEKYSKALLPILPIDINCPTEGNKRRE